MLNCLCVKCSTQTNALPHPTVKEQCAYNDKRLILLKYGGVVHCTAFTSFLSALQYAMTTIQGGQKDSRIKTMMKTVMMRMATLHDRDNDERARI